MMNGTLQTIDGRPALRFERRLAHPIERVWRAVTEPAELARWFVAPVPWTPALGETFEGVEPGGPVRRVRLEPRRHVRQRLGAQPVPAPLAVAPHADEP